MEANTQTYSKISECGKYGFKPYGPHTDGGELWAFINTPDAICIQEGLWHPDDMQAVIDDHEEEMRYFVASYMREVGA